MQNYGESKKKITGWQGMGGASDKKAEHRGFLEQ